MKSIRDGIEDWHLFQALRQHVADSKVDALLRTVVDTNTSVPGRPVFPRDPVALEEARDEAERKRVVAWVVLALTMPDEAEKLPVSGESRSWTLRRIGSGGLYRWEVSSSLGGTCSMGGLGAKRWPRIPTAMPASPNTCPHGHAALPHQD